MEVNPTRMMSGLLLLAGGLAAAMAYRPDWLTHHASRPAPRSGSYTVSAPDEMADQLARRIRARISVAEQLLAGEMTLAEAAAAFRMLNTLPPKLAQEQWRALPGRSDGEKVCRQVILWAAAEKPPGGEDGSGRLRELERELQALIARDGEVVLPSR